MVDLDLLQQVFDNLKSHHVPYVWGGKVQDLSEDTSVVTGLDCSGFTRYVLYRASNGDVEMPDGSWMQHRWVEEQNWRALKHYSDVSYAIHDPSRLFIAFADPSPVGHVWLIRAGATMESHGGVGVDSRPWNTAVLLRIVDAAFEVPLT